MLINKAGDADSLELPCAAIELVDLAEICKKRKEGLAKETLVVGWPCGRMVAADFTLATRETCNTHTRLPLGVVGFAFLISTWQHFCSNRC